MWQLRKEIQSIDLCERVDLITDHQALSWLKSLDPENETGRRERWLDFLQQFDMKIIQKKGKSPELRIVDYLSRIREAMMTSNDDEEEDQILVNRDALLKAQKEDSVIRQVRDIEKCVEECDESGKNKHMNHPNVAPASKTC